MRSKLCSQSYRCLKQCPTWRLTIGKDKEESGRLFGSCGLNGNARADLGYLGDDLDILLGILGTQYLFLGFAGSSGIGVPGTRQCGEGARINALIHLCNILMCNNL